jgi:hypothetical protein
MKTRISESLSFLSKTHLQICKHFKKRKPGGIIRLSAPRQSHNQKGISNNEQGMSNLEGRRRFAPYLNSAFGAPSFDIPYSLLDIRYSFFSFLFLILQKKYFVNALY